ncbi:single-stranded-DNA-specific exonuclease RecJ [Pseudanabaena sp. FACHB-2040]|nr:single-stranded-DNA-specific exonuclease RecJ [Pseudanabaena sp. FACHB-2040]
MPAPERRIPQQRWQIFAAQPVIVQSLAQLTGLSPLLAQVLINRGMDTPEQAVEFLEPESQLLPSPLEEFLDLAYSLELLSDAIATQQKIAICGDYDADGMTSTALLLRALRFLGANVDYAIPSRMNEGYGINERIVEEFYAEGIGVILTVDNGISAVRPIARARELGLSVIVTDHHDIPPELPPANAILNPKLLSETSPYRGVAGVGVAYILAICLAQALGKTQDLTGPLLELFTLGTIADLAPLVGVNRRWVRRGLKLLARSRILGVQALVQVAGLSDQNKTLKPEHIGFRLGPRINAVGRLSDPQVVIEMLTTEDVGVALERAIQCEQINQTRQDLCQQIEQEAIAWCEAQQQTGKLDFSQERVLVVVQPGWHHGVIGIVASRLVERYGVPVFIGTYEDSEQKEIRGSARGIPEFHVFEALQACGDLLDKFGGHKAAGGFSFSAKRLRQVKTRLVNYARQQLQLEHLKPLVRVDVQANLSELNLALHDQVDQLHPCGMENSDPVFWTPSVQVLEQQTVGRSRDHLKLRVAQTNSDGTLSEIKAIAWRWGEYCPLPDLIDIAYKLKVNEWQGNRSVELELVGVRLPIAPPPPQSAPLPLPPPPPPAPSKSPTLPFENSPPKAAARSTFKVMRELPASEPIATEPESTPEPTPESPPRALDEAAPPLENPQDWPNRAEFFYSRRRYTTQVATTGTARELTIRNPEGQRLVVMLPERQGFLCIPGDPPRPVDLAEPYYFNLLRAGLSALEIRQKTRLLIEKDELLAEKNNHIDTLIQQVALLEQKLNQLSSEQRQQFKALQQELEQQETAIQSQEAHIAQLQSQMESETPRLNPQDLKRQVRQAVGDKAWYCLTQQSQKDLYAAYKHQAIIQAEQSDPALADYSEAGLRLGFAVEREVIQPFFRDLYQFLLDQGSPEMGGLLLGPQKKYTLGMLPPILAQEWSSLKDAALKADRPTAKNRLYGKASAGGQMSSSDRTRLNAFLQQWEHPIADWFGRAPAEAASCIDQISKLRNIAAHAESVLSGWHYQLLHQKVLGDDQQKGLFQNIYHS